MRCSIAGIEFSKRDKREPETSNGGLVALKDAPKQRVNKTKEQKRGAPRERSETKRELAQWNGASGFVSRSVGRAVLRYLGNSYRIRTMKHGIGLCINIRFGNSVESIMPYLCWYSIITFHDLH